VEHRRDGRGRAPVAAWLSGLLVGRFFPDHSAATAADPHHDLVFDILVAVTLAVSATAIGVMAAFALCSSAWVAFRFAHGWRRTLIWSVGLGVTATWSRSWRRAAGPALRAGARRALLLLNPVRALVRA